MEHVVTADKPSETSKVTANLQISQAPGNGGVVNRRHQRLERRYGTPSERMKRTEEEQLYNLLMEQRSAEAPLGRDPYHFTQMAPEARLG